MRSRRKTILKPCGTSKSHGIKPYRNYAASGAVAFQVPATNATVSHKIQVYDNATTAAVEPTFVVDDKGVIYVTIGSDHTDWEMSSLGAAKSRLYAPKPVARDLWFYDDVKDHWDKLNSRCYAYPKGKRELYENNVLGTNVPAETLLDVARRESGVKDFKNLVYVSGGGGSLMPEFPRSRAWDLEIIDPVLNRKISHHYEVEVVWHRVPHPTKEEVPEW